MRITELLQVSKGRCQFEAAIDISLQDDVMVDIAVIEKTDKVVMSI